MFKQINFRCNSNGILVHFSLQMKIENIFIFWLCFDGALTVDRIAAKRRK